MLVTRDRGPVMDDEQIEADLAALERDRWGSNSRLIRRHLTRIERLLGHGVSRKEIVSRCERRGRGMTIQSFAIALYRARKQDGGTLACIDTASLANASNGAVVNAAAGAEPTLRESHAQKGEQYVPLRKNSIIDL